MTHELTAELNQQIERLVHEFFLKEYNELYDCEVITMTDSHDWCINQVREVMINAEYLFVFFGTETQMGGIVSVRHLQAGDCEDWCEIFNVFGIGENPNGEWM